jgi:hypothetical protein
MKIIAWILTGLTTLAWLAILGVAIVALAFVFGITEGHADSDIYSTIPGTHTKDRLEWVERGGVISRPIPGTHVPNNLGPRYSIKGGQIRPMIKGTNVPDMRGSGYKYGRR